MMASSFPVSSKGQAYCSVHRRERFKTVPYNRISGSPVNGISKTQLAFACLREAASAKAGAFLIRPIKMSFSTCC
jgi:hypothetical protein